MERDILSCIIPDLFLVAPAVYTHLELSRAIFGYFLKKICLAKKAK